MAEIEYQSPKRERLDKFLTNLFSCSRKKIQLLIKENKILVNNRPTKQNYLLRQGDKIENIDDKDKENQLDEIPHFSLKLDIVKETSDYLVINKPAGLLVHPLRSFKEKTLATALINFFPKIKDVGDSVKAGQINLRPGIVHRLDKDVSGLILVAKTQRAFDYFKEQFAKHLVQKEYLALVYGRPAKESGIITLPLAKNGAKTTLAKKIDLGKIKESWTEYKVIKYFMSTLNHTEKKRTKIDNQHQLANVFTLLKVKTQTGRTHQIRIHLKSIGHPIVGDKKYKIKRQKIIDLGRVFLHAYKLGFYDLAGEWQEYWADLPLKLKSFLKKIEM